MAYQLWYIAAIFLIWLVAQAVDAQTLVISRQDSAWFNKAYAINAYLSAYCDTTGQLGFAEITRRDSAFADMDAEKWLNDAGKVWWVRLKVHSELPHDVLLYAYFKVANITFYDTTAGSLQQIRSGYLVPLQQRPMGKAYGHQMYVPILVRADTADQVFYWRLQPSARILSGVSELQHGPELVSPIYAAEYERPRRTQNALIAGIMLTLVLYHLVLYFFAFDRTYLLMSLYGLSALCFFIFFKGYWLEFLDIPPDYAYHLLIFLVPLSLSYLLFGLFSLRFLHTEQAPRMLHYALVALIAIFSVVAVLTPFFLAELTTPYRVLQVVLHIAFFIAGVYRFIQGYRPALYYLIANTSYFLGNLVGILNIFMDVSWLLQEFNVADWGSAFQQILFSLGIASHVRLLIRENNNAQRQIILQLEENRKIQEQANEELEVKVKQRTEELAISNQELETTLEQISLQKQIIEKKNNTIAASINYAGSIQRAVLASRDKVAEFLPPHFILYKPRDVVGGDFYWFSSIQGEEDRLCIMVAADCTGHGIPGAFMSMLGSTLLHQIVNERKITRPSQILAEMHEGVVNTLNQHKTGNRDGMDIGICILRGDGRSYRYLTYAGAKIALVYGKEGQPLQTIKGDRWGLGGADIRLQRHFTDYELPIDEPITFYLFSDGFPDQFGGEPERKLTTGKFKVILQETCILPIEQQGHFLAERLQSWAGNSPQLDDIMVLGFRTGMSKL